MEQSIERIHKPRRRNSNLKGNSSVRETCGSLFCHTEYVIVRDPTTHDNNDVLEIFPFDPVRLKFLFVIKQ